MANVSLRRSGVHGLGVFTEAAFLQGDFVMPIDDSDPVLDRAALTSQQEIFIDVFVGLDGTLRTIWMKSPEKFINHSCDPNTLVRTDMNSGVRKVLARKDLEKGEELTWDYALNIWEEWVAPVRCACGTRDCRGMIEGNFFTLPRKTQRAYLPLLDEPFARRFADRIRSLGLPSDAREE
jgi:uncharacterized protein